MLVPTEKNAKYFAPTTKSIHTYRCGQDPEFVTLHIYTGHLEHAQAVGREDLLELRIRVDGAALVKLVLLDVPWGFNIF